MSNFFNNFISGMALGVVANSPFFGGMFCFGGFGNYSRVDFGVFANPFPSIFSGYYSGGVQLPPTTFANSSFPTIDFSEAGRFIWENTMNPNSDYNKQIREYYQNIGKQQYPTVTASKQEKTENIDASAKVSDDFDDEETSENEAAAQNDEADEKSALVTIYADRVVDNSSSKTESSISQKTEQKKSSKTKQDSKMNYDAERLKTKWSSKAKGFPDEFYSRVIDISKTVKCNPDDLMAVMNLESKGFNLSAKNQKSGATGLIQFMPKTARHLGTSTKRIGRMTALEQLEYVEKYLKSQKKDVGYSDDYELNAGELYALVFRPKYAKKKVLARRGELAYHQNKFLDINKDRRITKEDLTKILDSFRA